MKLRDGKGRLLCDGTDVAKVEVAASPDRRTRGLLGRTGLDGGLLISPCNGVHTFRMKFPIDVAFIDKSWRVVDIVQMKVNRLGRFRLGAKHVLEAEWGAFEQWGLKVGSVLEVQYAKRAAGP